MPLKAMRWGMPGALFVSLLLFMVPATGRAGGGDLDQRFSGDGRRTVDFGNADGASDLAIQEDDKLIVAGWTKRAGLNIALTRVRPNGELDKSFGTRGKVTTHRWGERGGDHLGVAVAIQDNGKILVANSIDGDFVLARFRSNGKLDRGFGQRGRVTTDLGAYERVAALALQGDGRIVLAGDRCCDTDDTVAIARYRRGGRLDPTFGNGGTVSSEPSLNVDDVAIQGNGKIVVGGFVGAPGGYEEACSDLAVARFTPDGDLDTSFSDDGLVTADFHGGCDFGEAVGIGRGGMVIAGTAVENPDGSGERDFALARFTRSGTLDTGFAGDGLLLADFGGRHERANGLTFDPRERLVAVGTTAEHRRSGMAVARLRPDGSPDAGFAGNGQRVVRFERRFVGASAVEIDQRGRIVVAGRTGRFRTGDFAIARLRAR
jgi:uncharacterized delta-60 repeat protein